MSIFLDTQQFPAFEIPTSKITDWKDLQLKVHNLFLELGYSSKEEIEITLVRGKKKIDVFANNIFSSFNSKIAVECKFWNTSVGQNVVREFLTVINDGGFDIGIIISKVGFQPGAIEASKKTNLRLYTFEEFQKAIGSEWFQNQSKLLYQKIKGQFHEVGHCHFNQTNPTISIINNNGFDWEEIQILRIWHSEIYLAFGALWPKSYNDKPTLPLEIYEGNLLVDQKSLGDVIKNGFINKNKTSVTGTRKYFEVLNNQIDTFLGQFESISAEVRSKNLDFSHVHKEIRNELPLRSLKGKISDREYQKLLDIFDE